MTVALGIVLLFSMFGCDGDSSDPRPVHPPTSEELLIGCWDVEMSWQNGDTLYFPDRQSLWAFSINYNMCIIEKRPDGTYGLDSSETYALSDSLLTICFSPQDIWKLRFGFSAGGDTLHLELADPGNGETAGVLFTKDDQFPASDYCGFEVSE